VRLHKEGGFCFKSRARPPATVLGRKKRGGRIKGEKEGVKKSFGKKLPGASACSYRKEIRNNILRGDEKGFADRINVIWLRGWEINFKKPFSNWRSKFFFNGLDERKGVAEGFA